jgi:hypothetical protein
VNGIILLIIGCEIAFWIFVVLGLVSRYLFRKKGLGLFFLAMTPAVDLILLVASALDLQRGNVATTAHALAAVYIGISVGFGRSLIRWADEKFHLLVLKTGGRRPEKYGIDFAKDYFKGWLCHLFSYLIGAGLIGATLLWVGDFTRTVNMLKVLGVWTVVLFIDLLITLSYFLWPKAAGNK